MLNNLYGRGKEPFWQQAYTDLVKFLILLRKVVDGYTTLAEIYHYAIDESLIERDIERGEQQFGASTPRVRVAAHDYHLTLAGSAWTTWTETADGQFEHPQHDDLMAFLDTEQIAHTVHGGTPVAGLDGSTATTGRGEALVLQQLDPPRTAPPVLDRRRHRRVPLAVRRQPDRRARVLSAKDGVHRRAKGRPEAQTAAAASRRAPGERQGARAELPGGAESGPRARVGRHAETRLPARRACRASPGSPRSRRRPWRDVLFVCDEYHAFATTGDTDPSGDERTFALSRQARLIPIVATQSISSLRSAVHGEESWRTLLQCFRTKIFLASSDEFTAKVAAELCGRAERLKPSYQLTEAGQDARVSLLTGRAAAPKSTVTASKHYAFQLDYVFQPKIFGELQNAQAVVLPYDGLNPKPPTYCYLKPHYLDVQTSYFDHVARGAL